MKQQVINFVLSLKGKYPSYNGKTRTMYIQEPLQEAVLLEFGYGLPFKLGNL